MNIHCIERINDDLLWVDDTDRRLALFENVYPIPRRVSYSAYLLLDERTMLFDTVNRAIAERFFENIDTLLKGRALDYVVVNHMGSDHCTTPGEVVLRYPGIQVVRDLKTVPVVRQFYNFDVDSRATVVKENDTLCTRRHMFTFLVAPMAHWPEVMVTYDTTDKTLFSTDAFGTFGAMDGSLFADEVNFERNWLDDARRCYTNVVGKYGPPVQTLLRKASGLDIRALYPLHGPIWREDISRYVDKYLTQSSYEPEEKTVMIAYGSTYDNTENAANILACKLVERGIRSIAMYGASSTHPSTIISEAFRCDRLVLTSATYNGGIFSSTEHMLMDLKAHNLQSRTVALMGNGSQDVLSGRQMKEVIGSMKNMVILEQMVTVKSSLRESQIGELDSMANTIAESMKQQH